MKEIWKPFLNGYYEISNKGRVCSTRFNNRIIKQHKYGHGYRCVTTCVAYEMHTYQVHRLVAKYFIGPCPKGKEVNHKDLDKTNNYVTNLEYKTHKKNVRHAIENGVKFGASNSKFFRKDWKPRKVA